MLAETSRLVVAVDDRFQEHVAPGFHPERPERLIAARRGLDGLGTDRTQVASRLATTDELVRVHSGNYIESLEQALRRGRGYLDGDTFFSPGTHDAAWRAAGSACALIDEVLASKGPTTGVLLARPPGHHATHDRAMGFCVLNNIAIAAAHARARGVERVAIVDWDVHHGNGTQDIFERDPGVLFVSLHQSPLYPGTGHAREVGMEAGRGRTVNVPLPAGAGGAAFRAAFERIVIPVVTEFAPQLVLVSAGFDAHERDPLGGLRVDTATYEWMARRLSKMARAIGHGRVALFLEGGYDIRALEESVAASVAGAMAGDVASGAAPEVDEAVEFALREVVDAQRPFWASVL